MTRSRKPKYTNCVNCGSQLVTYGSGRPRKYCDYKCRDVIYGVRATREGTPPHLRKNASTNNESYSKTKRLHHAAILHQLKLDRGACADCGMEINDRTAIVIEWDHRDPNEKHFTIAYVKGRIHIDLIVAEVAKCDAVCANCHRYRTHDKQTWAHRRNTQTTDQQLFESTPT